MLARALGAILFFSAASVCAQSSSSDTAQVRVQLSARDAATLSAQMDGRIVSFAGREGASFKKGAPLVRFDCRVERAELAKAVAERDAARDNARVVQRLVKLNSASELEAAKVKADLAAANADVAVRSAVVSRCTVAAPFDGRIAAEEARVHEYVTAGQSLLKVHDPASLEAQAIVPSAWLTWLKPEASFQFIVDGKFDVTSEPRTYTNSCVQR